MSDQTLSDQTLNDQANEPVAAPEPAPRQPGRRLLGLLGEGLWIVLAVSLAFAADQWRDHRANQNLAKKALDSLVEEIKRNRGVLAYFLPRHEKLLAGLPETAQDWDPPSLDDEDEDERFDPVFLQDTAWRTALETQALTHLDYRVVRTLTEVYSFQEAYADLTRDLIRTSFDLDIHDPDKVEAQFHMTRYFLFIFVANEQKLLSTYDEALSRLQSSSVTESTPPPG